MAVHGDHGACRGPMAKHSCVIMAEGREVVVSGYSICGWQAGPKWDGRWEDGVERLSVHYGRRRSHWEMDTGGTFNRNTGRAFYPNADTKQAAYRPFPGATEEIYKVTIIPDDNLEQVGCRLVSSKARGVPAPSWCPKGLTKTQRHRWQKLRQAELREKEEEEEHDRWFN
jgi:hypothetical protein